jgi:hypothetical protein
VALCCMWAFAIAIRRSARHALISVVAVAGTVVLFLAIGTIAPSVLSFDLNTEWRFLVWRENLFASLNSGLLGVGFGTPYYALSVGNIAESYRLTQYAEFQGYAFSSPVDLLYIRAQHSSFVNAFYRMGILGGGLLLALNAAVLFQVVRYAVRSSGVDQRIVAAAGAIFWLRRFKSPFMWASSPRAILRSTHSPLALRAQRRRLCDPLSGKGV